MLDIYASVIIFINIFFLGTDHSTFSQEKTDTSFINSQNRDALVGARRNPDISVILAHQALAESRKILYRKGMANGIYILQLTDNKAIYNFKIIKIR
jgi:hypothetical protein